jgi:hypothetical protein
MKASVHRRICLVAWLVVLGLPVAYGQGQRAAPSPPLTRADKEEFLSRARIVIETPLPTNPGTSWRTTLDDGNQKHPATVDTSTSEDRSQRDYRSNVAAYELDKMLTLGLVVPSVERVVNGQPASVTWWLDDFLMSEQDRHIKKTEPPDAERWSKQTQAVRVFDELIANAYRPMSPASYTSKLWDNLLITREWQIGLIDHTRAFGTTPQLQHPESLTQCDRSVLAKLRTLNQGDMARQLGRYLTSGQLDALEARRALIVTRFEGQIAANGERAVLYDLPPRR